MNMNGAEGEEGDRGRLSSFVEEADLVHGTKTYLEVLTDRQLCRLWRLNRSRYN